MLLIFDGANLITQGYTSEEVFEQYEAMEPGLGWLHIKDYPSRPPTRKAGMSTKIQWPFCPLRGLLRSRGDHARFCRDYPGLTEKLRDRGIPGIFFDLEPHLKGAVNSVGSAAPMGLVWRPFALHLLDYVESATIFTT